MVSKRQRLARKRFKEANPHLFPQPEPTPPKDPNKKKKKKNGKNKDKLKLKKAKGDKTRKEAQKTKSFLRKHPLRIPGMKPGDSCFICKSQGHIAKLCPKKAEWEKNKICLYCRRRGHSIKNCPDKSDKNYKKYCYNCGEDGHSLSNCPQPCQDGGTKFANCFICGEQGHLSKNCPKNTHGIYPKGGACKICGGVTHLAKHCPNKSGKDSVGATEMGGAQPSCEHGGGKPGHVTVFRSGDDLVDDFMADEVTDGRKGSSRSKSDSVSLGNEFENDIHVKAKKKHVPKVVNFLG